MPCLRNCSMVILSSAERPILSNQVCCIFTSF
uniref:Uncharacterized protein n=1 Tax=Rhizophora mucronata TaxID=61149 RepID=A0A2P2PA62_RHIMU